MKRKKLELTITGLIYLFTAVASALLAIFVLSRRQKLTPTFLGGNTFMTAILPLLMAECIAAFLLTYDGKYAFRRVKLFTCILRSLMSSAALAGIWAAILLLQKNEVTSSRYFFAVTLLIHFVLLAGLLWAAQNLVINYYYRTHNASFVLLVSTRKRAAAGSDLLKQDWSRKLVGIVLLDEESLGDVGENAGEIDHIPLVAGRREFVAWTQQHAVDEVFFLAENNDETVAAAMKEFVQMGISVHMNLPMVEALDRRLSLSEDDYTPAVCRDLSYFRGRLPMISFDQPQPKLRYVALKRLMDVLGGLVGAAIAVLLYVILGIAIKLDSPGPVLFAQERVGKNGRLFKIYKFRSMYIDAEARKAALMQQNEMNGLMFKMKDDPRITRVGKFIRKTSLDEFPQFFNVLKGDMSLVGTRPPTVSEFRQYSNYHKRRLAMKPGITGMWQVSGRSDIKDFEDVVKLDCRYIDNWSLWLDIRILLKTVMIVFTGRGSE